MSSEGETITVELTDKEADMLLGLLLVTGEEAEEVLKKGIRSYIRERRAELDWPDKVEKAKERFLAFFGIETPEEE